MNWSCLSSLQQLSAAVVRFRPVFAQYFLNLERDHGSGSTICPNLGPDHSERFRVVRFWFRTGSDLRTSQIYLFFLQMLNTTAIPPIHLLKSSPGVREALLAIHHSLNISDSSIDLHEFVCMCFKIPNRLASCGRQGPSRSWISTKDRGSDS